LGEWAFRWTFRGFNPKRVGCLGCRVTGYPLTENTCKLQENQPYKPTKPAAIGDIRRRGGGEHKKKLAGMIKKERKPTNTAPDGEGDTMNESSWIRLATLDQKKKRGEGRSSPKKIRNLHKLIKKRTDRTHLGHKNYSTHASKILRVIKKTTSEKVETVSRTGTRSNRKQQGGKMTQKPTKEPRKARTHRGDAKKGKQLISSLCNGIEELLSSYSEQKEKL